MVGLMVFRWLDSVLGGPMAIQCECGGEYRPARLASYDFTAIAGLPSELRNVRGLQCSKCGDVTLEGRVINAALNVLTLKLVRQSARLAPDQSRFLRKRQGLSQQALADRMGIDRVTVARWESSGEISLQHDLILRGMALAHCAKRAKQVNAFALVEALSSVHRTAAPTHAAPIVVDHRRSKHSEAPASL